LCAVDATLFEIGTHALNRLTPNLAEKLPRLTAFTLPEPCPTDDVNRFFDIALLKSLLSLGDGVLGLKPGRRQLLPGEFHPAIPSGRLFEDAPAHRKPTVVNVLLRLGDPQRLLLMNLLFLEDGVADRRPELGHFRQGPAELLGLVAVGQRRLKTMSGQILLPALNHGPSQPADEPLTVVMAANVFRLSDLVSFIESAVRQRTLSLSNPQDQHGRTLSSIIDD
jgi:hypothetical protein